MQSYQSTNKDYSYFKCLNSQEQFEFINIKKNNAFRQQNYLQFEQALSIYEEALEHIHYQNESMLKERFYNELYLPICNNMIDCYMILRQIDKADQFLMDILKQNPDQILFIQKQDELNEFKKATEKQSIKNYIKKPLYWIINTFCARRNKFNNI